MKILVCMAPFGATLSAAEASSAIREGLTESFPECKVDVSTLEDLTCACPAASCPASCREDRLAGYDVVITGGDSLGPSCGEAKGPYEVGLCASHWGVPVLAFGKESPRASSHEDRRFPFSAVLPVSSEAGKNPPDSDALRRELVALSRGIGRLGRAFAFAFPARSVVSAGGVVFRQRGGRVEVLVILDRFGYIALPKGHVEPGETSEEAALREVKEETGVDARIISPISVSHYRYLDEQRVVVQKRVDYFLMEEMGGTLQAATREGIRELLWVSEEDLSHMRTYPDMFLVLRSARETLKRLRSA